MYDMCITLVLNPKTVKYFVINVLNATRFFKVRAGSRASADQKSSVPASASYKLHDYNSLDPGWNR